MNTFFVKDSVYTAIIMPTDEVEAAVLKAIAKNHQSEGVVLTTQNTYILDKEVLAGSLLIKEVSVPKKVEMITSNLSPIESASTAIS